MLINSDGQKATNALINETSPYLLQHVHNPVQWHPWGESAMQLARNLNRPIIVSIGYSACHWCHVMERESFEDSEVAEVMNTHFINIKVDREERPDVDQVYMTAVQLMTGRGGWPLNCIALPDGRPLYGGTYFPKQEWLRVLREVARLWESDPERALEYATELTRGVQQSELLPDAPEQVRLKKKTLEEGVNGWRKNFDPMHGGNDRAPKFPMPSNLVFLLRQAHHSDDMKLAAHVHLTLRKMALGGICDQIGGGFSRYSVDTKWKVPHFEKMLYDNAQLVSLYSEAYRASPKPLYRRVVEQTLAFVQRELLAPDGGFYAALDADSEGEEGKFYVWDAAEFAEVLGRDADWAGDYYNVNDLGLWEHGRYILLRTMTEEELAARQNWPVDETVERVTTVNALLLERRETRIRPGLDNKQLTSWNALMMKAFADAYRTFGRKEWLDTALRSAEFLLTVQRKADGGLWRNHCSGHSTINGFLEDYSFTIEAFVSLYQATFDRRWLDSADSLARYAIAHFHDVRTGMFFVAANEESLLFARKMETSDNVTPSSNASLAHGLFALGHLLGNAEYLEMSERMLRQMIALVEEQCAWHSHWAMLLQFHVFPFHEIAVTGPDALRYRADLEAYYRPNVLLVGGMDENGLPLLEGRFEKGRTRIHVCTDSSCHLPVDDVQQAAALMA